MHKQRYIPGPCANCGKPEGGYMGSTVWGHDYYCCSEECGRAFAMAGVRHRLVQTNRETGLVDEHVDRAIVLLRGTA